MAVPHSVMLRLRCRTYASFVFPRTLRNACPLSPRSLCLAVRPYILTKLGTQKATQSFQDVNNIGRRVDLPRIHRREYSGAQTCNSVLRDEPSLIDLARKILTEMFGHNTFRHEQEAAISNVLRGENTLVIFPTGAGKSLCYQIPAILFRELYGANIRKGITQAGPGLTIVISPLVSLMKDQIDKLQAKGIRAESLDSYKTHKETQDTRLALMKGELTMLFCAPERFVDESFVQMLKELPGGIRLVAVDEAHCVSEWGQSFRPDYLKVSRFVKEVNAENVVCLTATATTKVAQDICQTFSIPESGVFRTSPYRPNLHLSVEVVDKESHRHDKLIDYLKKNPGPTLIYVTARKRVEMVARTLKKLGFNASAFHAGMQSKLKERIQDQFVTSKIPIVVSTIAFGMGLDKSNIRHVIHLDMPASVEQYSQQIGRAGRDGLSSQCIFFFRSSDFRIHEFFARVGLPPRSAIRLVLRDIFDSHVLGLEVGKIFKKNNFLQARKFDIKWDTLRWIYAALELQFGLLREIKSDYRPYTFDKTSFYPIIIRSDLSKSSKAIQRFSETKASLSQLPVFRAASAMDIPAQDITKKLSELQDHRAIRIEDIGVDNVYRICKQFPGDENTWGQIADKLYDELAARENGMINYAKSVVDLISGDKCFSLALAEHFDMGLPGGKQYCGHCSYCMSGRPITLPPKEPMKLDEKDICNVINICGITEGPRFLAMVASGLGSPRVVKLGLHQNKVFGSLAAHDFEVLLHEFTRACEARGWRPDSM